MTTAATRVLGGLRKERQSGTSTLGLWLESSTFRAVAALVFVLLVGCVFNCAGTFFQWGTHRDMLRQIAVPGMLACGMTLVVITSGIDLSVGSVLGFSAVAFSLMTLQWQWSAPVALLATVLLGCGCGLASGSIVAFFGVQPFIATLAMMVFARGMAKWESAGQKVSTAIQQADGSYAYRDLPSVFGTIDHKIWGENVAIVTLVFLVLLAICWVLLSRHRYGRYLYATGGSEESARLSGVPVAGAKLLAYGMSGALSAIAGICQAAQEQQGDPEAGVSYELTAIAMVVIGGTSLMGGRGGVGFTLLGVLTIGYLEKILSINAVPESSRLMLTGAIIVVAVLLQSSKPGSRLSFAQQRLQKPRRGK